MNCLNTCNSIPFDLSLNAAVLDMAQHFAPGYRASEEAPNTFKGLKAMLDAGQPLLVASEGSDKTIFGDPAVNIAFRAWHDWCHWWGDFDFSLAGEMATCSMQIEQLRSFYGVKESTNRWADLLVAEIVGQRRYYELHGLYITNQRAFARAYLADAETALSQHW